MSFVALFVLAMAAETPAADASAPFNLVTPTLGGLQLWTDELFFHGWHIQRHFYTGHCRLLNERNRRRAWGTFEQCKARLEEIKREENLPPMQGKAIIALHGLIRSRGSMGPVCDYLHEHAGYTAINVNYSSTRADVAEHARALKSIIDNLEGVERIDLITHSLGSLILRHYLADTTDPATGRQGDRRIKRIVMLAPPNQGAELAEKLGHNQVFKAVFGAPGIELAEHWPELEKRLATPYCEFGIIAGGRGDKHGWNPLLSGDDDGVVSVSTTRLPGASDFLVLPVSHTLMMRNPQVMECALRFFNEGCFTALDQRQPIPREP